MAEDDGADVRFILDRLAVHADDDVAGFQDLGHGEAVEHAVEPDAEAAAGHVSAAPYTPDVLERHAHPRRRGREELRFGDRLQPLALLVREPGPSQQRDRRVGVELGQARELGRRERADVGVFVVELHDRTLDDLLDGRLGRRIVLGGAILAMGRWRKQRGVTKSHSDSEPD